MKKIIIITITSLIALTSSAQTNNDTIAQLENRISELERNCDAKVQIVKQLQQTINNFQNDIVILKESIDTLSSHSSELRCDIEALADRQIADRDTFNISLRDTNTAIATNQASVKSWSLYGGIMLVMVFIILAIYLWRRKNNDSNAISEVRRAQGALQVAQTKMQEDAVKLDSKMVELLEKQIATANTEIKHASPPIEIDHSLALKVADEIVRIELNLSRMDASVKGFKQLSKAVERIKNNFLANGYEIVDMLGKPYNQGMKAAVTFVSDDSLNPGEQIITKIIKPQINYQQQMIQAAQIEVSQYE